MFRELVREMELEDEEYFCENCMIQHVEVTPKLGRWEILLRTKEPLGDVFLQKAGEHIKKKCLLDDVVFYQNVVDVGAALNRDWRELAEAAADGNASVYHLLCGAEYELAGEKLSVCVGGIGRDILCAHDTDSSLAAAIRSRYGFSCAVEFVAGDAVDLPPADTQDETPPYISVLEKKREAPAVPLAPPVSVAKPAKGSLVFGKSVAGELTKIADIEGETKKIVVAGTIGEGQSFGIRTNEFKTGTRIITFGLADDTDGISCKKFFKPKEKDDFDRVMAELSGGMEVRIAGSVRFDTYLNEYVLFVESLARSEKALRVDTATVKRVELHAHTTMSAMDAVVSAKDLIKTAAKWGHDAIAITDHGVVQAFPDAMNVQRSLKKDGINIKVIYGMEGYLVEDFEQKSANHIIILAKNEIGLRNLYRLVSLSHLRFLQRRPRLIKSMLGEFREGLVFGSACEAGELIRAIVAGESDEALEKIAAFYDYLEIQPIGNNNFLKRSDRFPDITTDDDLIAINMKVASLAKKLGKPLVATGDVHFLNEGDSVYRAILMKGKGYEDADFQPPLFFRTTEEMLAEFSYLDEATAYAAVVENPGKIAAMIEDIQPIPDALYSPPMAGAADEIRDMSYKKARELYGENLPNIVAKRLDEELTPIIGHGFAALYLIAQKLVKKSLDDGYLVGSRGSVGSSFVATMTGITEVNPLPPHWRCPNCCYSEFITDGSVGCGYDLPDKNCPVCDTPLAKDGHDIPFAVFLGFDGDKVPDIDLNFSGVYQPTAHKFTEIMFGRDFAYRAGTIATVADKTAFGYVMKYFEEKGIKKHRAFIEKLAKGCMGVKRTTGQHPAGIMVVPRDMDIHFFTPVQRPADDKNTTTITTHFDYHSISSRLVKLDILGHDDPTVIKMLEDLTHRDPKTIPFDDKATLSIFTSTDALGLTPEELGANSGAYGIPEFRTSFTRQMIDDAKPDCFSDLVRISGFSHGTDVWLGNAQDLINGGTCTLKNAISARDDIMMYLIHHGIDPLLSFKTMEGVRKGKGIKPDVVETLLKGGVPKWYIESCQKIKYLFPRAHATAYVMMAYRIAFCKVHYPLAFYAAYFSIRAAEFDANVVARGKDFVRENLLRLEEKAKETKLDVKESGTLIVLQLAWEMYLRGYGVEYVDIYKSDAEKFIILENSLLPPLVSLAGVGPNAAKGIAEARESGPFSSIDDLHKRSGISKTCVEILRGHGCLKNLPESDQIALF